MSSVKHLSLVNLIVGKEVVTELLQNNMTSKKIVKEINYLLSKTGRVEWEKNYTLLLGSLNIKKSNPYQNAARYILH